MPVSLSVIIVNWNTPDSLKECLESLLREVNSLSAQIIVVDNASSDASVQMLERDFPLTQIIKNRENFGFARANNQAMAIAEGEFFLLLNPDSIMAENTLQKMISFMRRNPRVGIVGPKILNPDRTLQLSCHLGPGPIVGLLTWFLPEIFYGRMCLLRNRPKEVGYVSGACLLIRRKVVEEIGLLDENFFMYSEEADWCLRARKKGWQIYFLPEAEVVHYGRVSVKKFGLTAMSEIRAKSNYLLINKHFGKSKAELFYISILLFANLRKSFWQICLLCIKKDNQNLKEKIEVYDSLIRGLRLGRKP